MRKFFAIGLLTLFVPATPTLALTTKQKMETCTFGANDQKLAGPARKSFISKCMANEGGAAPAKKKAKAAPAAAPAAAQ